MKSESVYDVIIVGGGLAGLSCAIHLSKQNNKILLIEKNIYPKHKVCGEYISNEVLSYLNWLGIDPIKEGAKEIKKVHLSTVKSNLIKGDLPLGGFGMSRYCLDELLANKAKENGVIFFQELVDGIEFQKETFSVITKNNNNFTGKVVIGAFGKRSNLDAKMNRKFIQKKSCYLNNE